MYIFPLHPTKIKAGSVIRKTNIIESESGLEQRMSTSYTRKTFRVDVQGLSVMGPIDLAFQTVYKPRMANYNLETMIKFFDDYAKGTQIAFIMKAWGNVVISDSIVRFSNDTLELEYLSDFYANVSFEVVTVPC